MNLYLLRHGQAESIVQDDAERRLTPAGRAQVRDVARQFKAAGLPLEACFSSDFLRARQTAAEFLAPLAPDLAMETTPLLRPGARMEELKTFLEAMGRDHVLLVSHNPLISDLRAFLMSGVSQGMNLLGTGELVAITFDPVAPGPGATRLRLRPGSPAGPGTMGS